MKYEVRASSLQQAVAKSLQQSQCAPKKKAATTINAGSARYNSETMYVDVERGFSYTISWHAHKDAGEGADYGISIHSYDGHGDYREAFDSYGSTTFTANMTGTIRFAVGVSYSAGSIFGSYPVDIDID